MLTSLGTLRHKRLMDTLHTFLRASRVKLAEYRVYRSCTLQLYERIHTQLMFGILDYYSLLRQNLSWFVLSWRRFGEAGCLHSQGIEKLIFDSETMATNYKHLYWLWICQCCRTGYRALNRELLYFWFTATTSCWKKWHRNSEITCGRVQRGYQDTM